MFNRFDACVSAVAAEVGLDPDRVSQDATNIKRWINDTRQEIYNLPVRFSAAEWASEFQGTANVTAGTVNATNTQAEVTGSGTAWTTALIGRYISIATGQWQRVAYVSDTTHLTLESDWNQGTVTNQVYRIWKRYITLPHRVGEVLNVIDMSNDRYPLAYYEPSEFYLKFGFGDNSFTNPMAYTQFTTSDIGDAYSNSSVFTVTCTANSPFVDFNSGSGIVTALGAGDRIIIGNSTTSTAFTVDRVLSDVRLSLTEYATVSTAATSATAFSMNRVAIQFYPAMDNTNTYYLEAYKRPTDLINNADLIEDGWYPVVKKGAIAKGCGYIRDPREQQKLAEYQTELKNLIRTQYKAKNPSPRLKPHISRRYGTGGFWGVFPSKFDLPY